MRWRSAASTSQSASTASLAKAAKEPTMLVLPVPPLPLKTTTSFTDYLLNASKKPEETFFPLRHTLNQGYSIGVVTGNLHIQRDGEEYGQVFLTTVFFYSAISCPGTI